MVESRRQEIAKLEALYASNPGGRVFVHLAEALRRAGEQERARSILEEGLARHPDSASGYVVLGRVLVDQGEESGAESAFRKVLQLDGGNLVALRCLGDLARGAGRPAEAATFYRELIARNPASEADDALQQLLHEMQRSAAEAALTAVVRDHEARGFGPPPAQPAEASTGVEERERGAGAAPDSVAPGRAGRALPAEPEYGEIELAALPGDLASFAGLAKAGAMTVPEEPEPEPRGLEDDIVVLIESSAAPLRLEELEDQLAAAPAEVNLLAAAPELDSPAMVEPPVELATWSAEPAELLASSAEPAELVPDATEVADLAAADTMDVDAAMLDVSQLSTATPFEVIPPASELTLVDDDTVRLALGASEQADETAPAAEPASPLEEAVLGPVAEEPVWAAVDLQADYDARTQDEAELAVAEAAAENEDLPWLYEPSEEVVAPLAAIGAGEETQASAGAEAETGIGSDYDLAADTADQELAAPADASGIDGALAGAAADAEIPGDFPVPLELAGEFEAPAEPMAGDLEATWVPSDEWAFETEPSRLSTEHIETPTDVLAFGEPEPAAAMPDSRAERSEPWPDRVAEPEPVAGPEFTAFAQLVEPVSGLTAPELEPATSAGEPALHDAQTAADQTKFAEDVEAEPDLATFLNEIAAGRNAAGFVPDAEFAAFVEPTEPAPDFAPSTERVQSEAYGPVYIEDIETEPDIAAAAGAETDIAREEELAVTGGPEPTSIAAAAGITSDSDLATETLADLYLAQGFAQRAAEVYQALVEQRPRDDRLAAKLHDAETAAAAGHGADVSEDARDVWLRDVEAAWTGGAGVTAQEPTPYAWTEREEREQEIGIGAYLRGLISWGTGEAARQAEPSTETVAAEPATVAGPGPAEAPAPAKPEPDWLAELTWGGTDIAEAGLEPAGEPHETAETGATGLWATQEETLLDATWTAPEPSKSWSADVEAPADPWLSAEPAAIAGAPAASPSPPVNPVEEAFNEWFGSPPEPGVPVTPPPHSGAVSGRDAGADRTRVGAAAGEEEEDEDLEMFRAWLQSLKK